MTKNLCSEDKEVFCRSLAKLNKLGELGRYQDAKMPGMWRFNGSPTSILHM